MGEENEMDSFLVCLKGVVVIRGGNRVVLAAEVRERSEVNARHFPLETASRPVICVK